MKIKTNLKHGLSWMEIVVETSGSIVTEDVYGDEILPLIENMEDVIDELKDKYEELGGDK